jgi:hypothetical protein
MNAVLNPNRIVKKKEGRLFSSEKMKRNATTQNSKAAWPSGLRRGIQAPIRKGEGSNPSAVIQFLFLCLLFGYTVVPSARQV